MAVVDIDHFKHVNDSHGHAAGDEVLRAVADSLAGHVRQSDLVARQGGEEFLVLMPETDLAGSGSRVADGAVLVAAADRALYAAKQDGRNRVVSDEPRAQLA